MRPPQDDLFDVLKKSIKKVPEGSILVIASKIVALHQGRTVLKTKIKDKDELIKKESTKYLPRKNVPKGYAMLTLKNNLIIPSAGIDESNSGEYYILWPEKLEKTVWGIYSYIKKQYKVKKFGVLIVDSHTVPLRRGVMGVALAYAGFKPLNDYRGTKDLFGRDYKVSSTNVADGLAASAVLAMGEGTERTPLALVTDIPFVQFISKSYKPKKNQSFNIGWNEDLYGPLLKAIKWKK